MICIPRNQIDGSIIGMNNNYIEEDNGIDNVSFLSLASGNQYDYGNNQGMFSVWPWFDWGIFQLSNHFGCP